MKRLYRSKKDSMIFGVCGGIAKYFNIDPTVVRITALIAAAATAIVPFTLGYLIAYFVIPLEGSPILGEE